MINRSVLLISIMFFSLLATAQSVMQVEGTVKDQDSGEPVFNALIVVKGTDKVLATDSEGYFKVEVEKGQESVLWISHLSYEEVEIPIGNSKVLEIRLTLKPLITEEILVSGSPLGGVAQSQIIKEDAVTMGRQKNVADLFIDVSGFNVVKRGAYAMDPAFRAFKYEQLNVQCDGGAKVMNACPNRMDPITTHIISDEIEKIEFIKGPFSMRFGPNFGGVINLITQEAPDADDYGFNGSVHAGYEMNGDGKVVGLSVGTAQKKYDLTLNGELHDFGNYTDGEGTEVASGFKSYDYSVKAGFNPGGNQRIQAIWRQSFGKDVLHAGLPMDTEHDNSSMFSIDYKKQNISPKLYSINAKGFYSYVDHLMTNANRPNFGMVFASSPVFATTYGGKFELTFTPARKMILYTGLDVNNISRTGDRTRTLKRNPMNPEIVFDPAKIFVDSIWQDASLATYGVFSEMKTMLNSKLAFSAGARVDYITTEIAAPAADFLALYPDLEAQTEINVSSSLTLDYTLGEKTRLQLAVGRGVRTASMIERYINHFSINIDPYEYVGNPELKPEANHQVELSLKGNVRKHAYGVSVFYSYITDYITAAIDPAIGRKYMPWLEPKNAKRFQNVDAATQAGFEAFVEVPVVKNLVTRVDVAYTKTKNLDFEEPLPLISPFTTLASIKYKREKFWLDVRARFSAEQNEIATSFGETVTPAYKTFDFRAGVEPIKGLSIGVSVLNIFDETYYDHLTFSYKNSDTNSGRIYDPGRNLTAYLKYKF